MGSWKFIIAQTLFIGAWMLTTALHLLTFDAYPWILLNLLFSIQAAFAGPLMLIAARWIDARTEKTNTHILTAVDFLMKHMSAEADILEAHVSAEADVLEGHITALSDHEYDNSNTGNAT
jgi:uncharacterized membrane protein